MSDFEIHFGGPDLPRGHLRDVLAQRVAAVPAGGEIDWVTYYFRDRRLAADLIDAHDRGVRVRVTLDGRPRTHDANDAVIALLRPALGRDLHVVTSRTDSRRFGRTLRPRLHEKLYCFSHPRPVAYIGSFNPSGDEPELAPEVLEEIGDQDRGHNVLVGYFDPEIVEPLVRHARKLNATAHTLIDRFRPSSNRLLRGKNVTIHFQPRFCPNPVVSLLRRCGPPHRVRIAASHLSGPTSFRTLSALAASGADVEVLAEATHRRVPPKTFDRLRDAGIRIRRAIHEEGLPMHAKFVLIDGCGERTVIFGSFNWTEPSRRTNREIGATSTDPALYDAFDQCWNELQRAYPPSESTPSGAR